MKGTSVMKNLLGRGMKQVREKKQARETKGSIPFFRKIQFKLIVAFMVPVGCIVFLGAMSYNKASKGIIKSYENSVEQTMNMMNSYVTLVSNTVQSGYKSYLKEEDLLFYFKGLHDEGKMAFTKIYYPHL